MDEWDESRADGAAAALAHALPPQEVFEILARYAARDFRSIGHKAIYVANAWRTLETIGWQHSEPVLRSLAYALLAREGSDPLKGDAPADRPWRRNKERLARVRPDWRHGRADAGAATEMLAVCREGTDDETADRVVDLLQRGIAPVSVWDGVMCAASELLMRNPGILSLHAVTTTNAIRYIFERTRSDETRRMLLLQNAAFLPFYRSGGSSARIDELAPTELAGHADRLGRRDLRRHRPRQPPGGATGARLPGPATRPARSCRPPIGSSSSKATTPTTTSSARRCSRTMTVSHRRGVSAISPRASSG